MATTIPSIVCLGVIGRNNNPLHITILPSWDQTTQTYAPLRTPLQFSLLLSGTLDVFEARARHAAASASSAAVQTPTNLPSSAIVTGDFGLLHALDDRLAAYGFETNTGVKFVAVVDMRGRLQHHHAAGGQAPGFGSAAGAAASPSGGAAAAASRTPGSAASLGAISGGMGLRDGELKVVFRAVQTAYVRLLQNPFYDPDEQQQQQKAATGGGGGGGKRITSRRFADEMRRIGESWAPGVTSL